MHFICPKLVPCRCVIVALTKMRISCHLLLIECGRYKKIPRVAPFVIDPKLVEFHHLLNCTHSSVSHIRGIFLESLHSISLRSRRLEVAGPLALQFFFSNREPVHRLQALGSSRRKKEINSNFTNMS